MLLGVSGIPNRFTVFNTYEICEKKLTWKKMIMKPNESGFGILLVWSGTLMAPSFSMVKVRISRNLVRVHFIRGNAVHNDSNSTGQPSFVLYGDFFKSWLIFLELDFKGHIIRPRFTLFLQKQNQKIEYFKTAKVWKNGRKYQHYFLSHSLLIGIGECKPFLKWSTCRRLLILVGPLGLFLVSVNRQLNLYRCWPFWFSQVSLYAAFL